MARWRRWTIGLGPERSRRSRWRPRPGWCLGVPEGERVGLSARIVDDAASGPPRSGAWAGGGARLPRQVGAGYRVQDTRSARGEAAQDALLPGTPRPRVQGEDGGGAVRLSQGEDHEETAARSRRRSQARRSRSSPTTRSPVSRQSPRQRPICRRNPACIRPSHATTNTSATAP